LTLQIWTSRVNYDGPNRLDVTVKSGNGAFSPTWDMVMAVKKGIMTTDEFDHRYEKRMNQSMLSFPGLWLSLSLEEEVVLCCYCNPHEHCHRFVLARIMVERFRGTYLGEVWSLKKWVSRQRMEEVHGAMDLKNLTVRPIITHKQFAVFYKHLPIWHVGDRNEPKIDVYLGRDPVRGFYELHGLDSNGKFLTYGGWPDMAQTKDWLRDPYPFYSREVGVT